MIDKNTNISNIEKFHYLRSSLKDKAAEVIQSSQITSENYTEAWDLLKTRFDNKRWIVQGHISALFKMQSIHRENHVALRNLVDWTLKHLCALKALKCPTEDWDDLVIYLVVSKLDPITSKEWETSLTDTKLPKLKQLTDFLSRRCQALKAIFEKSISTNNRSDLKSSTRQYSKTSSHVAIANLSCIVCKEKH